MFKGKRFSLKGNFLAQLALCIFISFSVLLLLSAVFALIANSSKDPTANLGIFSLCSLLLSGAVGGFVSAKTTKEGRLFFSASVAFAVALIMLIIGIIINGKIGGGALMNYICYIGTSVFFGFLASRERKRKKHRRR